jgi:TRAP transporter TAXI family solute receptor
MKTVFVLVWAVLFHGSAFALTIATGSTEGTYFKIAQDIKQVAEKEGITIEVVPTSGSFDNVNLLGAGKVDLAIMQLDVLRFVAEIMLKETGLNVLQEVKVVLNLYPEEIHIIAKNPSITTLNQLQGKKVAVGPEKSGSALTAEVLLAGFGLNVERVFDPPEVAVKKLDTGDIDADFRRRRAGSGIQESRKRFSLRRAAQRQRLEGNLPENHREIGLSLG